MNTKGSIFNRRKGVNFQPPLTIGYGLQSAAADGMHDNSSRYN